MHDWPGNVRQLRNNVERLLILVGGDAGTEITAAMMPGDLDATIATQVNGAGAEHLMAMPLRDAREAFERDYLAAQLGAVRQQYLEDRGFRRHGALGAASQTQASRHRGERPGRGRGRDVNPIRCNGWPAGAIDTGRQKSEM